MARVVVKGLAVKNRAVGASVVAKGLCAKIRDGVVSAVEKGSVRSAVRGLDRVGGRDSVRGRKPVSTAKSGAVARVAVKGLAVKNRAAGVSAVEKGSVRSAVRGLDRVGGRDSVRGRKPVSTAKSGDVARVAVKGLAVKNRAAGVSVVEKGSVRSAAKALVRVGVRVVEKGWTVERRAVRASVGVKASVRNKTDQCAGETPGSLRDSGMRVRKVRRPQ